MFSSKSALIQISSSLNMLSTDATHGSGELSRPVISDKRLLDADKVGGLT